MYAKESGIALDEKHVLHVRSHHASRGGAWAENGSSTTVSSLLLAPEKVHFGYPIIIWVQFWSCNSMHSARKTAEPDVLLNLQEAPMKLGGDPPSSLS